VSIPRTVRKDIIDWLRVEGISWAGRLTDEAFLDRIVDLDTLPSTDPRFKTARQDIWQHRVNNEDWENDWVYGYAPLGLPKSPDDLFLGFLTEMLHPVVRPDVDQARSLAAEFNDLLAVANVELFEARTIGTRPVWSTRPRSAAWIRGGEAIPDRRRPLPPPSDGLEHIWEPGALRLFLSHVSRHKVAVSALKVALANLGVSAFVAHEDIEPSLDWQSEIETALRSMHAMAALITPGFHQSKWVDQEIGFALGQGILVIPVRIPTNPYGFIGRHQAMRGNLAAPTELASALVDVLLRRAQTGDLMRQALVLALDRSPSYATTRQLIAQIERESGFSEDQLRSLEEAIEQNDQVSGYSGVGRLRRHLETAKA
jgi:hypothetical protein